MIFNLRFLATLSIRFAKGVFTDLNATRLIRLVLMNKISQYRFRKYWHVLLTQSFELEGLEKIRLTELQFKMKCSFKKFENTHFD
jgi:hypothetical protein